MSRNEEKGYNIFCITVFDLNMFEIVNLAQGKTRQREVTDAGITVPLSPHLQCRYSDDNIHFIQLKTLIDLRFWLGSLSNQT